jgi:hypothetical protein
MSMWTLHNAGLIEVHGPIPAGSQAGPSFTTGINTKGAWVQVTAGLAYPSAGIVLQFEQFSASQFFALDVGIGAAGSEIVVLPNLLLHGVANGVQFFFLSLPAGVPISVRGQSTTAAITARCGLWAMPEGIGMKGIDRWTTYGMNVSGATAGTANDAGGTAHTMSAWTELVSATTAPITVLHLLLAGVTLSANTSSFGLVELGVGAAGSEVVIVPNLSFRLQVGATGGWALGPFFVNAIPTGSRLAVRHQANSIVVDSSRKMQWAILAGG